jgi:TfoX/Sxy family transcriptional regulator of competence genes
MATNSPFLTPLRHTTATGGKRRAMFGKTISMAYYAASPECLDDARFMTEWASAKIRAARG